MRSILRRLRSSWPSQAYQPSWHFHQSYLRCCHPHRSERCYLLRHAFFGYVLSPSLPVILFCPHLLSVFITIFLVGRGHHEHPFLLIATAGRAFPRPLFYCASGRGCEHIAAVLGCTLPSSCSRNGLTRPSAFQLGRRHQRIIFLFCDLLAAKLLAPSGLVISARHTQLSFLLSCPDLLCSFHPMSCSAYWTAVLGPAFCDADLT